MALQPRRRVIRKADGTVEAIEKYRGGAGTLTAGKVSKDQPGAVAHQVETEFLENGLIETTVHYHGLSSEFSFESRTTLEYPGGVDQVSIQLHPKFRDFAGTPGNPENGALWVDIETGEEATEETEKARFEGFVLNPESEFFGVESYLVARPMVYKSYFRKSRPNLEKLMTIKSSVGINVPGIRNWLLVDMPFRQVSDGYQITEQYKGAPDPGWNKDIYG
jgi:hypothetical protein